MSERKQEVLSELRRSRSAMSIVELADRLGVHPNTVRFHLRGLLDDGRVESVDEVRGATGRPALMFRAHLGMDPTGPRDYQLLAGALATIAAGTNDDPIASAIEAGHTKGSQLVVDRRRVAEEALGQADVEANDDERLEELTSILWDLGFAPVDGYDGREAIGLRNCPYLELIPEHSSVICSLHLGLMRGALTAMGSSSTVTHLEPFAEPDLCVAHLGSAEPKTHRGRGGTRA